MSKSEMTGVEQDVSASCIDCPDAYRQPDGKPARPSMFVRQHIAATGHRVRVTRRKVTTYAPKGPRT